MVTFDIINNYSPAPNNNDDRTEVVMSPREQRVTIRKWHGQHSRSIALYEDREILLGRLNHTNLADVSDLVEYLKDEEPQKLLRDIHDGYMEYWSGTEYRGGLTQRALAAKESLSRKISYILDDLPICWNVWDWFMGFDVVKDMMCSDCPSIQAYVDRQISECSPGILNRTETIEYVADKLAHAAEGPEDDLATFAKKVLSNQVTAGELL